ncbi:MAG: DUF2189 domain-containing protein [Pararhizobium sp.]
MTDFHIMAGAGDLPVRPAVQRIGFGEVFAALKNGLDDFREKPSHAIFLCLVYPVAGIVLGTAASGGNALPLVFPLMSGFALLGPIAALGLYEISRRREEGRDASWRAALAVFDSPALPSINALGVMLLLVFVVWLLVAKAIYTSLFGLQEPASISAFLDMVFTTGRGWALIVAGNAVGLLFAAFVLMTTVVAFPLLLDRDVGAVAAVQTSARAVLENPLQMALWGVIVAALLALGSIPLFAGLAVVLPVLGPATWHLYRAVVAPGAPGPWTAREKHRPT